MAKLWVANECEPTVTASEQNSYTPLAPRPITIRFLVAGTSDNAVCGVRDHAHLLTESLRQTGSEVDRVWVDQDGGSLGALRLARQLWSRRGKHRADALLLHYSVFAFAWHGIPLSVPVLALVVRLLDVPVVLYAHEFAYPWRRRGWRGLIHAVSQRMAFAPLVAASDAVVVTTEDRVRWLRTRPWLPSRSVVLAPVFSNIRPHPSGNSTKEVSGRVGVFSFGAEGFEAELVTAAVARVGESLEDANLCLIGSPGADSAAGRRWREAAEVVGCPLTFTGIVEEAEVSRQLAACQVVVFPDPAGPTSRKTSLAAALAHGRAVVSFDGAERWGGLVEAGAVIKVEPAVDPLADALARLILDPGERDTAAARAVAFAEKHISPGGIAATLLGLTEEVVRERDERTPGLLRRLRRSLARCVLRVRDHQLLAEVANSGEDARPRVALVAHDVHDHGGMERACAELVRHCRNEIAFTIVAAELAPELRPLVERWVRIKAPGRPFPVKFAAFYIRAGIALRTLDVDLIHTVGAIVPNKIEVATVHFCHAGYRAATGRLAPAHAPLGRRINSAIARGLALVAERWSYRPPRVRTLAVVSQGLAAEIRSYFPGIHVSVTPNGVDTSQYKPGAEGRASVRTEQGVGASQCVVLFVGGDWDRKGLARAIEALALVRADGCDAILWVVGPGDEARFAALAETLGVANACSFFGRQTDTAQFYRAADIFLLPSSYETFSMVCFEAAAAGLPLVISAIHGAIELVGSDEAGIVVEREPSSIAAALSDLAGDPVRRCALGAEAQRRSAGFTWEASATSVVSLYRSLLVRSVS